MVRWGATDNAGWTERFKEVNHGELPNADAQNILFGDGHVERESQRYSKSLDQVSYQYNRYATWGAQFILWHWGTGQ
jgi:hypothetical protein